MHGGPNFRLRLRNLGLAEGTILSKTHSHPFHGPVTVRVQHTEIAIGRFQHTEIAIGRGMASHILVEAAT